MFVILSMNYKQNEHIPEQINQKSKQNIKN